MMENGRRQEAVFTLTRKQHEEELTRKEGLLAWSILLFKSRHTTPTWDCRTGGMEWNGMEREIMLPFDGSPELNRVPWTGDLKILNLLE